MTCTFHKDYGLIVTFYGTTSGFSWAVPADWSIAQLQRYVRELAEFAA